MIVVHTLLHLDKNIQMSNKSIGFSKISHRRQKTQQVSCQSPEIRRIKRITSEAKTDLQLSPFDMISWKQKLNYRPNEVIKKMKFQNDIAMHLVARQKVRIMPKMPQRKISNSNISYFSDTRPTHDQGNCLTLKTKFLTESQESLLAQYNSPTAQKTFIEKHKELYLKMVQKHNESKLTKARSLKSHTEELKRELNNRSKQKEKQQSYFKTKYDEVNKRMETIMKNWQKSKKSINERYHQLWAKPKHHRLILKSAPAQQSLEGSGQTSSFY